MSRTFPMKTRCSRGAMSPRSRLLADRAKRLQVGSFALILAIRCGTLIASSVPGQTAVPVPRPEEKDRAQRAAAKQQEKKAQRTSVIEFHGQQAFDEKTLRSQLKEPITTIDEFGLTPA